MRIFLTPLLKVRGNLLLLPFRLTTLSLFIHLPRQVKNKCSSCSKTGPSQRETCFSLASNTITPTVYRMEWNGKEDEDTGGSWWCLKMLNCNSTPKPAPAVTTMLVAATHAGTGLALHWKKNSATNSSWIHRCDKYRGSIFPTRN